MTVDPAQLLRQLEPAVRPAYAPGSGSAPRPPLESERFDALLARAQAGAAGSGRVVTVNDASVTVEPSDLRRLESAADVAEMRGAAQAVLLMDGRGLLLDVASRSIGGELAAGTHVADVDAAVLVQDEN
jgi:hypothetical protein